MTSNVKREQQLELGAGFAARRRLIVEQCLSMRHGQRLDIPEHDFDRAFPENWLTGQPGIDVLLEKLPGVNWGSFTAKRLSGPDGFVRIERHPAGRRRVREDWDRR